jgi:hypothetical protein
MIKQVGWLAETIHRGGDVPPAAIRAAKRRRWLVGSVLAGAAGLLLMGVAILLLRRQR